MSLPAVTVTISIDTSGMEDALARLSALLADLPEWVLDLNPEASRTTFVMAHYRKAQRLARNAPRRLQRLLRGRPARVAW